MVAHVLRLRLAVLAGAVRGRGRIAAMALTALIVAATALTSGAVFAAETVGMHFESAVVVVGSAVSALFFIAPVLAGAVDPLEPRRFATFSFSPGRLTAVLGLAGLVSVPVAALVAVTVCVTVVRLDHGVPWAVAVAAALTAVLTCAMAARVGTGLAALFLRDGRTEGVTRGRVVAMVLTLVLVGAAVVVSLWRGAQRADTGAQAVASLAYTPMGAAWAIPSHAAAGGAGVWGSVGVATAVLAVLCLAWWGIVRRQLTTPEPAPGAGTAGLGWFAVLPGTAMGAIAARSLLYWFKEGRYLAGLVAVPVAAVLMTLPLLLVGVPVQMVALLPAPVIALFLGWLPHNDVAYDSTAVWMHVSAGVHGSADRVGRLVPVVVVGVPLLAAAVSVGVVIHGDARVAWGLVGASVSLFLCGLGLSSLTSAAAPYPATLPGDGPFRQPEHVGAHGGFAQLVVLAGSLLASAPVLWWAWLSGQDPAGYAQLAFWSGIAIGCAVLTAGILAGAAVFNAHGARLVEQAMTV